MQDRDREQFLGLVNAMAATFSVPVTDALLDGYWMALEDVAIEAVARGARAALRGATYMPRPAEIRELSGELSLAALTVQAWAAVRKAAASVGAYESVDFGPVVNAAIRLMGGWQRFCTEENNDFVRKDFERTVAALSQSGVGDEQGKHLVGLHEMSNRAGNYAIRPPVRITDVPEIPNNRRLGSGDARRAIEAIT